MLVREQHEPRYFGEAGEAQGPFKEQQVFWFECNYDVVLKVCGSEILC